MNLTHPGHTKMQLDPDTTELLARARSDLRMGVPVVLFDATGVALVLAAESADDDRFKALKASAKTLHLVISARRAETLKARVYDVDLARIVIPRDATLDWIQAVADPADDLNHPMKGPLKAERDGPADIHRASLGLVKSAHLLPAAIVVPLDVETDHPMLTKLDVTDISTHIQDASPLHEVIKARLPMQASEAGRLHIWRPEDGGEEHYAIEIGSPPRDAPVLARLHSACFTGDILGSLKCDCGPQLRAALAKMGEQGAGVLLYLNQEGRGIGLANKMRAYALQDQGFDTVEANHRLGFEDDERDFRIGANILKSMGFTSVRLLTNNPAKIDMMQACGIEVVQRVPLKVGETVQNKAYLATKAAKSGHLL